MKNTHPAQVSKYWADFLGIVPSDFLKRTFMIVEHRGLLAYNGAWIFRHKAFDLISVPAHQVIELGEKVGTFDRKRIFSPEYLATIFPSVDRIIGPVFQGYFHADTFSKVMPNPVRRAKQSDIASIKILAAACDLIEWEHSSIDFDDQFIFVVHSGDELVSVANLTFEGNTTCKVGIATHPSYRGQGFGRLAVSCAVEFGLELVPFVRYQTLVSNIASISIAKKLGCRTFATTMAIRFK